MNNRDSLVKLEKCFALLHPNYEHRKVLTKIRIFLEHSLDEEKILVALLDEESELLMLL